MKKETSTPSKGREKVKPKSIEDILSFFLFELNDKGLISDHDFDYEEEVMKYLEKNGLTKLNEISPKTLITVGVWLSGHDEETVEQMYND